MDEQTSCLYCGVNSAKALRDALGRTPNELYLRTHVVHDVKPRPQWHAGELAGGRPIRDWYCTLVLGGKVHTRIDDWSGTLAPGTLMVANHKAPFGQNRVPDESLHLLSFRFGFYRIADNEFVQPSDDGIGIVVNFRSPHHIERVLWDLYRAHIRPNDLAGAAQHALLFIMLQEALRAAEAPADTASDRVDRVVDYLWDHPEERLSLAAMAEMAGCSPNTLLRLFRAATGKTPVDYQINVRCQRAAILLTSGDGTVTEIAAQLGYPDAYCLSRQFKKVFGVSPTQYRDRPFGYLSAE